MMRNSLTRSEEPQFKLFLKSKIFWIFVFVMTVYIGSNLKYLTQKIVMKYLGILAVEAVNNKQIAYEGEYQTFTDSFKNIWEDWKGEDSSIDYKKSFYLYELDKDDTSATIRAIPKQKHLLSVAGAVGKYRNEDGEMVLAKVVCLARWAGTERLTLAIVPTETVPTGGCIDGRQISSISEVVPNLKI